MSPKSFFVSFGIQNVSFNLPSAIKCAKQNIIEKNKNKQTMRIVNTFYLLCR